MEAERPVAAGNWLYLYGIVRRSDLDLAGVKGIEGGADVFLVRGGELACAVSPVSRAEYNQETLTARAQQLDWIAPRAVRHQQVVHRLLATGAVIPLKFGTLCSTGDDVRDILFLARQEPWLRLLEFLQGREEWGVRIYADANLTRQALEQECSATDGVRPASPGEAYFLKKKRQKLASERMIAHIAALDDQIYGRLAPCAVDARKGSCQGSPAEPSRLSVLNAALLMEQDRSAALEEIAGQLEADYGEYGMVVELTGPWAPYSFCGGLDKAPAGDGTAQVPEPCGN